MSLAAERTLTRSSPAFALGIAIASTTPRSVMTMSSSGTVNPGWPTKHLTRRMPNIARKRGAAGHQNSAARIFDSIQAQRTMSRFNRVFALMLLAGCRDPRAEANIAQAMTEVGTTLALM